MPEFYVEKSIHIDAPVKKVFDIINDFHQWRKWSPWLILEPGVKVEVSEDGKSYSWEGKMVGSGNMVSDRQEPHKKILQTVNFIKPWKSSAPVTFLFKETPKQKNQVKSMEKSPRPKEQNSEGGTEVTWTMIGALPFFMFWMKKSMTAYIGMDYQRGLLMLKDYVETGSVPSQLKISESNQYPGYRYIGIKTTCQFNELGQKMENDFTRLTKYLQEKNIKPANKFFSIYHQFDMVNNKATYTSGIPFASIPDSLPSDMISGAIPAMKTYDIIHKGPYRHLGNAWSMGHMYARAKKFKQDKKADPFEIYENLPGETNENDSITRVCFPMKPD
jgi:effector-binding domain-containing protein